MNGISEVYLFSASDIPRQMLSWEKLLITHISVAESTQRKLRRNVVIVMLLYMLCKFTIYKTHTGLIPILMYCNLNINKQIINSSRRNILRIIAFLGLFTTTISKLLLRNSVWWVTGISRLISVNNLAGSKMSSWCWYLD